jgi:hypothetical protein
MSHRQQQQQQLRGELVSEWGPLPSWLSGSVRELEDEIDRFTNRVQLVR